MMLRFGILRKIRKHRALKYVSRSIHTHTTELEREALYSLGLACSGARQVIEIGSYLGASTVCLAAGLSEIGNGILYCVDTWSNETMPDGQRDTLQEFLRNTCNYSACIKTIRKRSDQITKSDFHGDFDLAFIDGDHSYVAVRNDVDTLMPLLSNGAIVAFHDSKYFPGVSKVIGECLASGLWQLQGAVDNLAWLKYLPSGVIAFGIGLDGVRIVSDK
jgi:predicted O-methyltransferase YrrM